MRLPTVIPVALPAPTPTPSRRDQTIYPQSCVITGEYIAEHDAFILRDGSAAPRNRITLEPILYGNAGAGVSGIEGKRGEGEKIVGEM